MAHPAKRQCIRSATTIQDLNDHVLRETFQNLSDLQLSVMADVCSDFKRNAAAEFAHRYKKRGFNVIVVRHNHTFEIGAEGEDVFLWQLSSILRNFGHLINSLTYHCCRNEGRSPVWTPQPAIEKIVQHCSATLARLNFMWMDFPTDMIPKMQVLLTRVQTLELVDCRWESPMYASEMLSFCSELQTLSISCYRSWPFTAQSVAFLKLKSLELSGHVETKSIRIFLGGCPQLNEIKIQPHLEISSEIFSSIVEYSPQIEKINLLHFEVDHRAEFIENARMLKHLTALKYLALDCQETLFSPVIKDIVEADVPLEYLQLKDFIPDRQLIGGIVELKKLKGLSLVGDLDKSDILEIVRNLNELNQISLWANLLPADLVEIIRCAPKLCYLACHSNYFPQFYEYDEEYYNDGWNFDEHVYMEILDLIKKRELQCPFNLKLKFFWREIDVPMQLLSANEEIFRITQ